MNFAEPLAAKRRIPVYLVNSLGSPVTSVLPTGAQIRVCQSGGALTNATGVWIERGSGAYFYECTVLECTTLSYLLLYIDVPNVEVFVWVTDIDTRIKAGETSSLRRHIPIYLTNTSGDPVSGLTLAGAEVQLSKAGGAFYDGTGVTTAVGSGVYNYEAVFTDVTDAGPLVLKVNDAAARLYLYSMDVIDSSVFVGGSTGYFGMYFGGSVASSGTSTPAPIPVPVPIVAGTAAYVGHVNAAILRLPQQFKSGTVF